MEAPGGDWCRLFWAVAIDPIAARHPEGTLEDQFRYEKLIFEEDWPVIETQRPREAPLDSGEQAHTRADHFSLVYRKIYVELMGLASAAPVPVR